MPAGSSENSLSATFLLSGHEPTSAGFALHFPLRILIAEDNYINRRLLVLMLRGLGYEPIAVENGRECLQASLGGAFDLILTDLDMPEMSGTECAESLRRADVHVPIIAVTASDPDIAQEMCALAGINGYLSKPVDFAELRRILKETSLRKWVTERNLALANLSPSTPAANSVKSA